MRRAQISVEYVLLLGFAFAVLIPSIFIFNNYSQRNTATVNGAQFVRLGDQMMAVATQSLAQGEGSWLTLDVNIPDTVEDIEVITTTQGTELIITYRTNFGDTKVIFFSDFPMAAGYLNPPPSGYNGSVFFNAPHAGRASFRFTSGNGAIGIRETQT